MILITGASGFIGTHLSKALVGKYGKENILAFTSVPSHDFPYLLHNNYNFDQDLFLKSGYGSIDTIIHAGAFTPKSSKQANDWENCNDNIINTIRLLRSNLPNLKRFIYLSTLDVYGEDQIITEESLIDPVSFYGMSKLYCEKLISLWAVAKFNIYQILRIGHVYGPGEQLYKKIIPISIKNLIENRALEIWGTGEEIRSFIYIDDVIAAILRSLDLDESVGPINVVSSNPISINGLLNILIRLSGKKNVKIENIIRNGIEKNCVFDNYRMQKLLIGERTELEEGLLLEWKYMNELYA